MVSCFLNKNWTQKQKKKKYFLFFIFLKKQKPFFLRGDSDETTVSSKIRKNINEVRLFIFFSFFYFLKFLCVCFFGWKGKIDLWSVRNSNSFGSQNDKTKQEPKRIPELICFCFLSLFTLIFSFWASLHNREILIIQIYVLVFVPTKTKIKTFVYKKNGKPKKKKIKKKMKLEFFFFSCIDIFFLSFFSHYKNILN